METNEQHKDRAEALTRSSDILSSHPVSLLRRLATGPLTGLKAELQSRWRILPAWPTLHPNAITARSFCLRVWARDTASIGSVAITLGSAYVVAEAEAEADRHSTRGSSR